MKNVPETNGRVGIWGTSYPGWLTLAALRDPHPALVAAVPFNPVVDVWKADDWFHWGAFRALYAFDFIYGMETRKGESARYPYEARDLYDFMLDQGAAGTGLGPRLDERHEMWPRLVENPGYGPYWRDCAADQWFDAPKRMVPTLHVHGLWDQEDIYGSPAAYAALEKHDTGNDTNFFVAGPWYHGQHFADGSGLGALDFGEDTAARFRDEVLVGLPGPLPEGRRRRDAPAPVTVFETGSEPVAPVRDLAPARRDPPALPAARGRPGLRGAAGGRRTHGVRLGPGEARSPSSRARTGAWTTPTRR